MWFKNRRAKYRKQLRSKLPGEAGGPAGEKKQDSSIKKSKIPPSSSASSSSAPSAAGAPSPSSATTLGELDHEGQATSPSPLHSAGRLVAGTLNKDLDPNQEQSDGPDHNSKPGDATVKTVSGVSKDKDEDGEESHDEEETNGNGGDDDVAAENDQARRSPTNTGTNTIIL